MTIIRDYFSEFSNADQVHDFFGQWPTLHDAEVIELVLNRELGFDLAGPKLAMTLYGCSDCAIHAPLNPKHCRLVLLFDRVEFAYLQNFNHQNSMADFVMEKYYCDRLRDNRYKINFGEFGAELEFTCKGVTVISVEPFEPANYFVERSST